MVLVSVVVLVVGVCAIECLLARLSVWCDWTEVQRDRR